MIFLFLMFILLFSFLIFGPVLIVKIKASRYAAKITLKEAFSIYNSKNAKAKLFKALAIVQQTKLDIPLMKLETHLLAGGDPEAVAKVLADNRDNSSINFMKLAALNHAKKDLQEFVRQGEEKNKIVISGINTEHFSIEYFAVYKIGHQFAFGDFDQIEEKIRGKLERFFNSWDSSDSLYTRNFIFSNILNNEYWEEVLKVNLIEQDLHFKFN